MLLRSRAKSAWRLLGPGFVTGSSDDDPSGIATYSQTGAQFGYSQLWLALWMLPFMVAIQEVCGRVGMVTGRGLASVLREHYPRHMLYGAVALLVIANTVNIGADALSEALGRKASLNYTFRQAPTFYAVIALATVVGVTVNFVGIKPFQMLCYSAVINGIIAPFLMAMIMLVGDKQTCDGRARKRPYCRAFRVGNHHHHGLLCRWAHRGAH